MPMNFLLPEGKPVGASGVRTWDRWALDAGQALSYYTTLARRLRGSPDYLAGRKAVSIVGRDEITDGDLRLRITSQLYTLVPHLSLHHVRKHHRSQQILHITNTYKHHSLGKLSLISTLTQILCLSCLFIV